MTVLKGIALVGGFVGLAYASSRLLGRKNSENIELSKDPSQIKKEVEIKGNETIDLNSAKPVFNTPSTVKNKEDSKKHLENDERNKEPLGVLTKDENDTAVPVEKTVNHLNSMIK